MARGYVTATWRWDKATIVAQGGGEGLTEAARDLARAAQQEVPVSLGPRYAYNSAGQFIGMAPGGWLRDSLVVRGHPRWKWMAEVAYTEWYATIVHERLDLHHERGRAKWLELAALSEAPKVEARVRSAILRRDHGIE